MGRGRSSSDGRRLLRARSLVARTFYRELRAAGYERADVLEVVNQIMDLLTNTMRAPTDDPELPDMVDAESGLLMPDVLREVVAFELSRVRGDRQRALALVLLDLELSEHVTHAARRQLHERVALLLGDSLRAHDAAARLASNRYCLMLCDADESTARRVVARLRAQLEEEPSGDARLRWRVRCHAGGDTTFDALLEDCVVAAPLSFPSVAPPVDGRAAEGASVALALGGGAARAAAHVGVLRVLRRLGVKVSAIAATSAGAFVAAMYAQGMHEEEILERFESFRYSSTYRALRAAYRRFAAHAAQAHEPYFRRSSLVFVSSRDLFAASDELFSEFVEYFVGADRPILSTSIPFACCATDLVEGRAVTLAHGSMHQALKATCAVPGLFPPQVQGAMTLVDGSMLAEVPVAVAREIAPDQPLVSLHLLRPAQSPQEYRSSAELAVRAHALVHRELVREQLQHSGFVLPLPVQDVGWLGFERSRELADVGERLALEASDSLVRVATERSTPAKK